MVKILIFIPIIPITPITPIIPIYPNKHAGTTVLRRATNYL